MCPNRDLLSTYEEVFKGVVVIHNNTPCLIVDIRRVRFKMLDGTVRALDKVRHISD